MTSLDCKHLSLAELIEYWWDDLGDERTAAVEAHLFGCASCTTQLEHIVNFGMATRELVQQGRIAATLTPGALDTLKATGLQLREYHLDPGGSVNCTIAPGDDLVVSHLRAPLAGVHKLDLLIEDADAAWQVLVSDIGFDPSRDEVIVIPKAEDVRKLHQATQRMRLFSVDDSGRHLLGEYWFHHSRHPDMK